MEEVTPASLLDHIGPSLTSRKNFVLGTVICTWALILLIIFKGEPSNSLHASALAWAFAMNGGVLGMFIFGVSWDNSTFKSK